MGDDHLSGGRNGLAIPELAAFVAMVALVWLLDQLGFPQMPLAVALALTPVVLLAWLGIRRGANVTGGSVPQAGSATPLAGGLAITATTLSGALMLGVFGAIHGIGYDGLVYLVAPVTGIALVPMLLAAPLQRSGAATLPDFIGRRFGSGWPRLIATVIATLTCLLLAAAELTILGGLMSSFAGLPYPLVVTSGAAVAVLVASLAGLPRLRHALPLLAVIVVAALLVPLLILSAQRLGAPLGQLGIGTVVTDITGLEQALLRRTLADARTMKPLLTPFLTLDLANMLGIALALSLGTAALPHIAGRALDAPTAVAARWSFVWALALLAVAATALPALAALTKLELLSLIGKGTRLDALPVWVVEASRLGVIKVCGGAGLDGETIVAACRKIARHPGMLRLQDIAINAEALLVMLPRMAGLAFTITALLAAGITAALLAGLCSLLLTMAAILAPDTAALSNSRLRTWLMAGCGSAAAAGIAIARPADALTLLVWGATLAASGLLPVLVLGIWWRRASTAGAVASMVCGAGLAAFYIIGTRCYAVSFHSIFEGFTDVSASAQRRFADLTQAVAAAPVGAAREAAATALDSHAQRLAGWFGLRNTATALFSVPIGLLVLMIVSLLSRRGALTPGSDRLILPFGGAPMTPPQADHSEPDSR
jgi:cation/acetate symporter